MATLDAFFSNIIDSQKEILEKLENLNKVIANLRYNPGLPFEKLIGENEDEGQHFLVWDCKTLYLRIENGKQVPLLEHKISKRLEVIDMIEKSE